MKDKKEENRPFDASTHDRWICYKCGAESYWPRTRSEDGKLLRGGPSRRALDRRYGYIHYCWRGKHRGPAGTPGVLLYHEDAPNPSQPKQDDELLKYLSEIPRTKSGKVRKRKK